LLLEIYLSCEELKDKLEIWILVHWIKWNWREKLGMTRYVDLG